MPLTKTPSEVQADLRSKSLDDREAAIIARERALNTGEALKQREVLDKQIAERQDRLASLGSAIQEQTKALERIGKQLDQKQAEAEKELASTIRAINKLQTERADIEQDVKIARSSLAEVQKDIKAQQTYLGDQEKLVNDTIAEWNIQLGEFKHEGDILQEQLAKTNQDIARSEKVRQEKSEAVIAVEQKLERLQGVYESKVQQLKADITDLEVQKQTLENQLEVLTGRQKAQIEELATREDSLKVREGAIQAKELELTAREQRLNMKLGLVGGL